MHTAGVLDDQSAKLWQAAEEAQGMKKAVHQLEYCAEQSERTGTSTNSWCCSAKRQHAAHHKAPLCTAVRSAVVRSLQDMANVTSHGHNTEQKKWWKPSNGRRLMLWTTWICC
jgi:hypothetical protein